MSDLFSLSGKRALITGSSQGIGFALAKGLAQAGSAIVLNGRDETKLMSAAKTLSDVGADVTYLAFDVTDHGGVRAAVDKFEAETGAIDILVNNAGMTGFETGNLVHDPENASLEAWRGVHAVNLDGTFLGCRAAIAMMKDTGTGSIINISSRSGLVGIPGAAAYASSKAAIINHTRTVALYCAQQGWKIRCNAIAPAAILTPIWEPMIGEGPDREERMAALVADTPLKRFGQPDEVAALAVMLAGDGATYMTGETLTLDGGLLAGAAVSPG